MRLILFAIIFCWPLAAADITITISIPDAQVTAAQATLDAYRATQLDADGNPKYPTNRALMKVLLRDKLREVLKLQCNSDPSTCIPDVETEITTEREARTRREQKIEALVQ